MAVPAAADDSGTIIAVGAKYHGNILIRALGCGGKPNNIWEFLIGDGAYFFIFISNVDIDLFADLFCFYISF